MDRKTERESNPGPEVTPTPLRKTRNKTVITVISKIMEKTPSKDACLVVIYGMDLGKKCNLDKPSTIIGRTTKVDIQIDQDSVSRNHAKILNTGKSIIIRDMGSTNGTFVNDQLVDECVLRDGDIVKIGRTIFKFLSNNNIEHAYHEEIYKLTTVDGLTQIYNKRYFIETVQREIGRARRYGRDLSLIMFDIDLFKNINDTFGHLAGDFILKLLAQLIKANIRREDILARYGGEEFVIILPEISHSNALLIAEKIRRLVEEAEFKFEETNIPVTVSLGVSTLNDEFQTESDFIKNADTRMYEAKRAGRNKVGG